MTRRVLADQPRLAFSHVANVRAGVTAVTFTNRLHSLPPRPATGSHRPEFTCESCGRLFRVTVHSIGSTRRRRARQVVYGLLGVAVCVLSAWLTFGVGMPPDGPDADMDPDTASWIGGTGLLMALSGLVGLTSLFRARSDDGVSKLRLVRKDGRETVWLRGHKLFGDH